MNNSKAYIDYTKHPYKNLATAIVERAILDYKIAIICSRLEKISECENFFRSEWFEFLVDLDGEFIIQEVKKICQNMKK